MALVPCRGYGGPPPGWRKPSLTVRLSGKIDDKGGVVKQGLDAFGQGCWPFTIQSERSGLKGVGAAGQAF